MNRIGEALKEARSKRSITLEDVHAKIKIHPRVLQILEDGKFDKLPSPTFVKSFLKSYADFLEVNSSELLETYEREERKDPEQILFIRPAEERMQRPIGRDFMGPVIVAAAAFGVAALIFYGYKNLNHVKWTPPKANRSVTAPANAVKKEIKAAVPASVKKNADWLRSPEQGNFPKINKATPLELKIKAVDKVWLRVTCDGKMLFQSILEKGAEETWPAKKEIEIWTGNSSNMALTLNKSFLGSPGKGVIKKMVISHEGVKVTA